MSQSPPATLSEVGILVVDGTRTIVRLRVAHDGLEYVGRLCFEGSEGATVTDRAAVPGRTIDEVVELARRLSEGELRQRYERALQEKRRYRPLRRATDDILMGVRHLNRVAISLRAGLLDPDGAAQEIADAERHLHELIDQLRSVAGVEDEESAPS